MTAATPTITLPGSSTTATTLAPIPAAQATSPAGPGATPATTARVVTAQLLLQLFQPGQAFAARVTVPPQAGGVQTLATPKGDIQIRPQTPLPQGTPVRAEVFQAPNGSAQLRLTPQAPSQQSQISSPQSSSPQATATATATPQSQAPSRADASPSSLTSAGRSGQATPTGSEGRPVGTNSAAVQTDISRLDARPAQTVNQTQSSTTVREALLSQSGLAPLLANLVQLTGRPPGQAQVPEGVRQLMSQLLGLSVDGDGGPTAESLRIAIQRTAGGTVPAQNGGTASPGLESLLTSLKSALSRLAASDRPASHGSQPLPSSASSSERPAPPLPNLPPQGQRPTQPSLSPDMAADEIAARLVQQTDGALSRLKLMQLAQLPDSGSESPRADAGTRDLALEIPILRDGRAGILHMRIGRDGQEQQSSHPSSEDGDIWRIRFGLDFEDTGPVHAAITLKPPRIGVAIWAEDGATATRLRGDLDTLGMALEDAALEVDTLVCHCGRPPAEQEPPYPGQFMDALS